MYRPQVHVPAPAAYVVGVADFVTKLRPFAADIAYLCHIKNSRLIDSEGLKKASERWFKGKFYKNIRGFANRTAEPAVSGGDA
jgi:hypothetical protein